MPNSNLPDNPHHDAVNAIKPSAFKYYLDYINDHGGMDQLLMMSHPSAEMSIITNYLMYERQIAWAYETDIHDAYEAFIWRSPASTSDLATPEHILTDQVEEQMSTQPIYFAAQPAAAAYSGHTPGMIDDIDDIDDIDYELIEDQDIPAEAYAAADQGYSLLNLDISSLVATAAVIGSYVYSSSCNQFSTAE